MKIQKSNSLSFAAGICAAIALSILTMAVDQNLAFRKIGWVGTILELIEMPAFALSATLANSHDPPGTLIFLLLLVTYLVLIGFLYLLCKLIRNTIRLASSKRS